MISRPTKAAFFYAIDLVEKAKQHRVGYGITTPRSHLVWTWTTRSAAIFIVQIHTIMNYKKVKEHLAKKEEAVKKVIDFLGVEYSYEEMMTEMAIAQTIIMQLMDIANSVGHKQSMEEIATFFSTIQCLLINIQDLSDFAKLENQEEDWTMKEIIEDYRRENFTATEWVMGAVGAIVFTLLTAIVWAYGRGLERHQRIRGPLPGQQHGAGQKFVKKRAD